MMPPRPAPWIASMALNGLSVSAMGDCLAATPGGADVAPDHDSKPLSSIQPRSARRVSDQAPRAVFVNFD